MALAFVGTKVATSAISAIVRKSFNYLEKYIKAEGMKPVKERLERTLPRVQAVLDAVDTELVRERSEALDGWLWQLRDAVEDAEDVLDEAEYYRLEKDAKSRGNQVRSYLYSCKEMLVRQYNTTFKAGIFKRMIEAMKKLDEVAADVEIFIRLVDRSDSSCLRHICHQEVGTNISRESETSSFVLDGTIIGRDTERSQIVEWLIKEENNHQVAVDSSVTTFVIVGLGGMGKTSLAQSLYLDQRVKQYFDMTMWVCVSNHFDVCTLTRKIIEEISGKGTGVTSLNKLQEIVKGHLVSKKFLLVLDDVWNDERRSDWEKMLAPLMFGKKGSKILLTTRMQSVVDIVTRTMDGGTESFKLEGLQEEDLLRLLNKHAFFGVNPDDYMNLQGISQQIAKKLSGSPLAAKVMGGLLNNSIDTVSWNMVLKENISNIEYGNDGIMNILKLSYQNLPSHLQACFRYCSLFEEDYQFRKDTLVELWVGSGLIQLSGYEHQRLEDVGESYLRTLTKKSFFELRSSESTHLYAGIDNAGEYCDEYYVMHDLLHELARKVSKKECIWVTSNNHRNIPATVRHLQLHMVTCSLIVDFSRLKKLRTLIIDFDRTIVEKDRWNVLGEVLTVATKLRVLQIYSDFKKWTKLPFENPCHLRYLSCSWPFSEGRYPPSIYKLYHLQKIQSYSAVWESCRLSNLVNLKHLDYSGAQTGPPPNIGQLTCLQHLRVSLKYVRISALQELKDLRHLYIEDIQNENVEEAKLAKLAEKENLVKLSLRWYHIALESGSEEEYFDNLQPHRNLAKLNICGCSGSRFPLWLENPMMYNLTYVSISHCVKWQILPPFGSLPSLRYLYLSDMGAVKRIDKSFYGCGETCGFPSLKLLSIRFFPALEEWAAAEGLNLFPQLKTMFIRRCEALQNLPELPSSLAVLKICRAGLTNLLEVSQLGAPAMLPKSSLSKLTISDCPNLVKLEPDHYFFGLDELIISGCENLLHVPIPQSESLPFLKTLWVKNCPKLIAPEEGITLPPYMRRLYISSCRVYEACLLNSLYSLTSLTTLQLHDCEMTTLPSAKVFKNLTTLQQLEITHCKELTALGGIEELTSLRELNINDCDKVEKNLDLSQRIFEASDLSQISPTSPLRKLEKLRISNPFLLDWEPLRRVDSVTYLTIDTSHRCLPEEWLMQNRNHLKCLGVLNATRLEFLPSTMASLAALETMFLKSAMVLQSLPELPASLEELKIIECHPVLEKRCQKRRGRDWHKIAHIQDLQIVHDTRSPYSYSYYHGV